MGVGAPVKARCSRNAGRGGLFEGLTAWVLDAKSKGEQLMSHSSDAPGMPLAHCHELSGPAHPGGATLRRAFPYRPVPGPAAVAAAEGMELVQLMEAQGAKVLARLPSSPQELSRIKLFAPGGDEKAKAAKDLKVRGSCNIGPDLHR